MAAARYEPLSTSRPEWGRIAVLPWDSEIFGFAVADLDVADASALVPAAPFAEELAAWAAANSVALIGCSVPSGDNRWRASLPAAGFYYVDSTLTYTISHFHGPRVQRQVTRPWRAEAANQKAIEDLAGRAFQVGRYHADPYFPAELANHRYRRWISNTFSTLSETTRVYALGPPDAPLGMVNVTIDGDEAQFGLGGVDPTAHRSTAGFSLLLGTIQNLRDCGVRRVVSKLSTGNLPILHLVAYFGGRFSDPRLVFHWRAPNAPALQAFAG